MAKGKHIVVRITLFCLPLLFMPAWVQANPFLEEKKASKSAKSSLLEKEVKMVKQEIEQSPGGIPAQEKEKAKPAWRIKGRVNDDIIIQSDKGDITIARDGTGVDDCVVNYPFIYCSKDKVLFHAQTQLKGTSRENARLKQQLEASEKEMESLQGKLKEMEKKIKEDTRKQEELLAEIEELTLLVKNDSDTETLLKEELRKAKEEVSKRTAMQREQATPEVNYAAVMKFFTHAGTQSYAEGLGEILWIISDEDIIIRVGSASKEKADSYLKSAIKKTIEQESYVYYVLDKSLIDLKEAAHGL